MSSTRNNSEIIAVGLNRYYLGDFFDKHLHAGMDLTVFTAYGEERKISKGEWIGRLFSYAIVMGAPALILHGEGGYFGQRPYYLRYYGVNTIDEKIMRYNYRDNKWVTFASRLITIAVFPVFGDVFNGFKQTLPTVPESDKEADERDAEEKALDERDKWFNEIKKPLFFIGAALAGYKALTAEKEGEQLVFGGVAAYLAYEGSTL